MYNKASQPGIMEYLARLATMPFVENGIKLLKSLSEAETEKTITISDMEIILSGNVPNHMRTNREYPSNIVKLFKESYYDFRHETPNPDVQRELDELRIEVPGEIILDVKWGEPESESTMKVHAMPNDITAKNIANLLYEGMIMPPSNPNDD